MATLKINDIRSSFLSFFESKNHLRQKSASLLPVDDPTLLFTTAGMVPFKDFFSGAKNAPASRLVSVQKCLRTTDLESVGKTKRHLSFFEMLGNFSFGDYFKKEAIEFAWEYSTQFLPFAKEQIWISIFENDDEAHALWHKHIGVPENRIVRLGRADNFWGPAGESGACGPCSELYLDRGAEYGTGPENEAPGGSGDRFMEFWNLVFNQFDFQKGSYLPLAQTGIDTGAGLERLGTLVQGVDSVFDTDELKILRERAGAIFAANYSGDNIVALRVLADHIRTLTFAMSDGIFPSNESRGYVLRRVLRRAMLFGRKLGQKEPQLYKLCETVNEVYGKFYSELTQNIPFISDYIREEENRFLRTLDSGAQRLENLFSDVKSAGQKTLAGKEAFQLYDTFGFPLEMTIELAEIEGLAVDTQGFKVEMEKQRERGRSAWKGALTLPIGPEISTQFTGFDALTGLGKVTKMLVGNTAAAKIEALRPGDLCFLVTDKTPFYAEGGGQLGDTGFVKGPHGHARIGDCRKQGDAFVHLITDLEGFIDTGETVQLHVDSERRQALMRHHSATHLLNAALRAELGEHIKQSGSLVHPDYLRFDFSHPKALSAQQIRTVESIVNQQITGNLKVDTAVLNKTEAEKRGAVMTFGEKYGDVVRVVEMGSFSKEFCGGTHVQTTADIGVFFIEKESSPGAGNRRIEAVAGEAARAAIIARLSEAQDTIAQLAPEGAEARRAVLNKLSTAAKEPKIVPELWYESLELCESAQAELQAERKAKKKIDAVHGKGTALAEADALIAKVETINEKRFAAIVMPTATIAELKTIADAAREKTPDAVYVLLAPADNEYVFVCATSTNYAQAKKIALNQIVKSAPKELAMTGGGKPEMAQGKIGASTEAVIEYLKAAI